MRSYAIRNIKFSDGTWPEIFLQRNPYGNGELFPGGKAVPVEGTDMVVIYYNADIPPFTDPLYLEHLTERIYPLLEILARHGNEMDEEWPVYSSCTRILDVFTDRKDFEEYLWKHGTKSYRKHYVDGMILRVYGVSWKNPVGDFEVRKGDEVFGVVEGIAYHTTLSIGWNKYIGDIVKNMAGGIDNNHSSFIF